MEGDAINSPKAINKKAGERNIFNEWQRFCSASNIKKSDVKTLYDKHRSTIKSTNPTLWFNIVGGAPLQQAQQEQDDLDIEEGVSGNVGKEKDQRDEFLKDIYVTLSEIKSFLIYLCSEPSRHVKSYIELEEKSDEGVLLKWSTGLGQIMSELDKTKEFSNANLIIDIKQIYLLVCKFLFPMVETEKLGPVQFVDVTPESETRIKMFFDTKRKKFFNELLIPVVTRNDKGNSVVYFFYSSREVLSLIERRYASEMMYHSDYVTTTQNKAVEQQFFLTQMVYVVLHGMLHLHCSLYYKNAYMAHEDHNYYQVVERIVPKPLYRYFLMPSLN
ncbi:MAG: hypothetical protein E6K54_08505 [Gammaproteobacteria bacterium]|nr:MAG: hypothetical protein E6K54_08505 [Gammaproteobacteria bacterium]